MAKRISMRPKELVEMEIKQYNNVPVPLAAEYMGVGDMFIRCGLRYGILPIGSALKRGTKYTYHISPEKLLSYQGAQQA